MEIRRQTIMVISLAIMLFVTASIAYAFDGRSGDRVIIAVDTVVQDDLYAAANEVTISGKIEGDLLATGRQVRIKRTATIARNLIVAAQFVQIEEGAQIGGDLIAAGQNLWLDGAVAGSVIGFSAQMHIGGQVGGDLVFWGGDIRMAGQVDRDGIFGANRFELIGRIGRNVRLEAAQITIDPTARIGGDLYYRAPEEVIPAEVVTGHIQFTPSMEAQQAPPPPAVRIGEWSLAQLRRWASLLLVGGLIIGLAFQWIQQLADEIRQRPLASLGWGFVAFIAIVGGILVGLFLTILIAILLRVITLGDLAWRVAFLGILIIAGAIFLFSLTWAYLSQITVSFLVGRLIFGALKSPIAMGHWWPLLVGSLFFILLTAIPYLGTLITLVVVLVGFGALARWLQGQFRRMAYGQLG